MLVALGGRRGGRDEIVTDAVDVVDHQERARHVAAAADENVRILAHVTTLFLPARGKRRGLLMLVVAISCGVVCNAGQVAAGVAPFEPLSPEPLPPEPLPLELLSLEPLPPEPLPSEPFPSELLSLELLPLVHTESAQI